MTIPGRGELQAGARRCWALVPCAGIGARAGTATPKQYALLAGRPLVAWTLEALGAVPELDGILVVVAPGDTMLDGMAASEPHALGPRVRSLLGVAAAGGPTRARTVAGGLEALLLRGADEDDWVLVHDAARCLVHPPSVSRLIEACRDDAVGGLLALPVSDTLKRSTAEGAHEERVSDTLARTGVWAAQTPQMFRISLLRRALQDGMARADTALTDEASAVEALGLHPRLVRGDLENLKITWPGDFALAERLLRGRRAAPQEDTP